VWWKLQDEQSGQIVNQNGYTAGRFDSNTGWVISSRHLLSGATAFMNTIKTKVQLLDGGAFRVRRLVL
jgi:hypothetical protein